ncbi:MAG: hypothetical protein OEW75_11435 [Cyclobacteriaceae bacterium]|nr:hypothetical protein [Cyclobacteriaceae bacterium]
MTGSIHYIPDGRISEILLKFVDDFIHLIRFAFGIFGLIILIPLILLFQFLLIGVFSISYLLLRMSLRNLYNSIDSLGPREKVRVFYKLEILANLEVKNSKTSFLLDFIIIKLVERISFIGKKAVQDLRLVVYPDFHKPVSKETANKMKDWVEDDDWDDEEIETMMGVSS